MKIKIPLFLLIICLTITVVKSQDKIISDFNQGAYKYSSYSIYAIDAETGKPIYQSPAKSLSTASTMKLVTTAIALDLLGADFRFETNLRYDGNIDQTDHLLSGNLVVEGGCDPAFYSSYFQEHYLGTFEDWAKSVKNLGISKVAGNLVIDLSALDKNGLPGGWIWEDMGNYYGAGISPLSYADNLYKIHFRSSAEAGKPVDVAFLEPHIEGLQLENRVTSSDINRDMAIVYGAPNSFQQFIEGTIPKGRTDFVVKASMPNPAKAAAEVFRKTLLDKGIEICGEIQFVYQSSKEHRTKIVSKFSPPLSEIIVPLNQESINLFAEHLLREIGRKTLGNPSLESGTKAILQFCKEKNIFAEGFYPDDGSGLSRSNSLSARTLVEIIQYMYNSKNREDYFRSLPVAGRSGTLRNSFKGTALENNLTAKTGSMERVRSIAGMLKSKSGKAIIFALIINNYDPEIGSVNSIQEKVLNELYYK